LDSLREPSFDRLPAGPMLREQRVFVRHAELADCGSSSGFVA
jgi:hypothetical protein